MTRVQINQRLRNRLLVAVAVFVYLAFLTLWEVYAIRAATLEPLSVFTLGATLGALTGAGYVVRRRWLLYLASRA